MEINVWMRQFAQIVSFLSSLFASSSNQKNQNNGGALPSAPASGAPSILTSTNATSQRLRIIRNPTRATTDALFGDMDYNGQRIGFTMENRALAIPAGQYEIEIYDSLHAGHPVPRLRNVIGRSEIEIHCGNVPEDSKGCIIVGLDHTGDTLERSRDAFNILFPLVSSAIENGAGVLLVLTDS